MDETLRAAGRLVAYKKWREQARGKRYGNPYDAARWRRSPSLFDNDLKLVAHLVAVCSYEDLPSGDEDVIMSQADRRNIQTEGDTVDG